MSIIDKLPTHILGICFNIRYIEYIQNIGARRILKISVLPELKKNVKKEYSSTNTYNIKYVGIYIRIIIYLVI